MTPTRREFIRNVGIAIGSLAMARCATITGDRSTSSGPPRDRLRNCWLRLDWLAEESQDWDRPDAGLEARDQLTSHHQAALNELVAAGELEAAVANQVQLAFYEASYHVWRANCGMTCYEPVIIDYTPASASGLVTRANLLAEMADSGQLDPDTVALAQASIEQEIAFLSLSGEETQALYDALIAASEDGYSFPSLSELDLEITPETAAAARFLVDLLLEDE